MKLAITFIYILLINICCYSQDYSRVPYSDYIDSIINVVNVNDFKLATQKSFESKVSYTVKTRDITENVLNKLEYYNEPLNIVSKITVKENFEKSKRIVIVTFFYYKETPIKAEAFELLDSGKNKTPINNYYFKGYNRVIVQEPNKINSIDASTLFSMALALEHIINT
jgi:hypothetical protein